MQHLDDGVLNSLVDGEVPSSELGGIQRHLDSCTACRARFDETRAFADEADGLVNLIEVPGGSEGTPPVVPRPRWGGGGGLVRNLAWAAVLILAVGLGYAAGNRPFFSPDEVTIAASPPAGGPSVQTPVDEVAALAKSDTGTTAQPRVASPSSGDGQAAGANRTDTPTSPRPTTTQRTDTVTRVQLAEGRGNEAAQAQPKRERAPAEAREVDRRERVAGRITTDAMKAAAPRLAAGPESQAERQARDQDSADRLALRAAQEGQATESYTQVTLREAVMRLGGSLRLIDGLVPDRLEASEGRVRVIYPWMGGELVLAQRLVGDSVVTELTGPAGAPADSLVALRARIR